MSDWVPVMSAEQWQHLTAALLHTLWQGALVGGLLALYLRRASTQRPNRRYIASVCALCSVVVCGLITWAALEYEPPSVDLFPGLQVISSQQQGEDVFSAEDGKAQPPQTGWVQPADSLSPWLPTKWSVRAAWLWLAGVVAMLGRAALVVIGAGRVRRRCRPVADAAIETIVEQLRCAMRVTRRVRVVVGEQINMPAALGIVFPAIALPASALTGIPVDQLRAILAHELAHVRRYDVLVNLVQLLVEALLFFNPAVWWISRHVRIEREACCDALAVATLGARIEYARTLADWVERLRSSEAQVAGGSGFGSAGRPMALLDRVKRLVVADHRPSLRIPWYGFAAMVVSAGACLAGLRLGSGAAVAFAAELMSPRARLKALTEINETHGTLSKREYGQADKIAVSGTIRTEDGNPLPDDLRILAAIERPGLISMQHVTLKRTRFTGLMEFGAVYLCTQADGYAPAFAGPLTAEPGGAIGEIELILRRGFEGRLRLVDEHGQPVAGAQLEGRYAFGVQPRATSTISNGAGIAVMDHCADRPIQFNVTADGYQYDRREWCLEPGETATWQLTPAAVTDGVFLSAATAEPIEGVQLRLVEEDGPVGRKSTPYDAEILATTNHQGRFVLSSLRDDSTYQFLIDHADYRREWLKRVKAGQHMEIELLPPLYIRGQVLGPLEQLARRRGGPTLSYRNPYRIGDTEYSYPEHVPVHVRDGVGHFEITGLWPGRVTLFAAGKTVRLDLQDEPIENLVIDLTPGGLAAEDTQLMRTVVLRFDVPPDAPSPGGTLRVDSIAESKRVNGRLTESSKPHWIPVEDGRVQLNVPVPGLVSYSPQGLIGYWVEDRRHMEVLPGDEPFLVTVPTIPAGAIYGRTLESDGSPGRSISVSLVVIEKPPLLEDRRLDLNSINADRGLGSEFMLSPLPLDGTYRVVAHREECYVVSPPVTLDELDPIQEVELALVEGVTIAGQVRRPDGTPAAGVDYEFGYSTPFNHGFGGRRPSQITDSQGRFVLRHVNSEAPGHYTISVSHVAGCQPLAQRVRPAGEPMVLQLTEGLGVSGVVVDDATGGSVPDAEVYASVARSSMGDRPVGPLEAESPTDLHGEFWFTNMADRDYRLHVRDAQLVDQWDNLVTAGQAEPITLRVILPEWSSLKPRGPHGE